MERSEILAHVFRTVASFPKEASHKPHIVSAAFSVTCMPGKSVEMESGFVGARGLGGRNQ